MKIQVILLTVLLANPVFAAKLKNPKCIDVDQVSNKAVPEYLGIIDGYNKAGQPVEVIDFAGIISESQNVKNECAKNKSAKVATIREKIKKDATSATASPATAQKLQTALAPTKATCQDFIALGESMQPIAAYWVAGHSKSGKAKSGEVDEVFLEQPVATLVEECRATPTASFYDKTKAWLKKHI